MKPMTTPNLEQIARETAEKTSGISRRQRAIMASSEKDRVRFWALVEKGLTCWIWKGRKSLRNYGDFSVGRSAVSAHRMSYFLANGRLNPDMMVCHSCDNTLCVNPAHLFEGTNTDNVRDCMAKGRSRYIRMFGQTHGSAKLTDKQVAEIRNDPRPSHQVAKEYPVCAKTIQDIRSGRRWKDSL